MRACEADRCEHGATVNGRWCPRHSTIEQLVESPLVGGPPEYALEADPVVEDALERRRDELVRGWDGVEADIREMTARLDRARARRVEVLDAMRRTGMSLGDIAEVTGLTRQRIGQLLR